MTNQPVVVGVDGSTAALHAVRWAAERALGDDRPLRIIHAYELPIGFPSGVTEEESILDTMRSQGRRWLATAQDTAREAAPDLRVETALAATAPTAGLLRETENARLLVLGNRGRHALTGLLVGSTSQALAGQAHCPVVLIRGGGDSVAARSGPIVVGVDGTVASESAVAFAFAEASAQGATLVALHAWAESVFETALAGPNAPMDWGLQRQIADEALAERLAGWQEKYPDVRVERELVHDRPARALRRCAQTARLVVVGRRGHGGFREMVLGSTSQHLLHHATCPVAVVRTETVDQR